MNRLRSFKEPACHLARRPLARAAGERRVQAPDPGVRRNRSDLESDDLRQGDHGLRSLRRPAAGSARIGHPRSAGDLLRARPRGRSAGSRPSAPRLSVSDGWDGFVSFECTPDLADDAQSTVEQAIAVRDRLDRPNVLIKVAATDAGIEAIEELTARGVSVNVTLLFSLSRYEQAIDAYLDGLERRAAAGEPLAGISSVASFFVSRVDAAVDPQLEPGSPLRGRVAIANAQRAYARYLGTLEPRGGGDSRRSKPGRSGRFGQASRPRTTPTRMFATSRS